MCTSTTSILLISLFTVLIDLGRTSTLLTPPDVRVISPSEFQVILAPEEHRSVKKIRVDVNKATGTRKHELERVKPVGRVIPFSDKNLTLKKGDVIYYSLIFDNGNGRGYEQNGTFIFNGVFKDKRRQRRAVYFYDPSSEEYTDGPKQNRYFREDYGSPPHYHHHGHYHDHHPHFDHFGGPPPFGYQPYPNPGPRGDPGHDHRDHFGNRGPWDDDGPCDNHGHGQNGPWNGNTNNGNNGFDNSHGGIRPSPVTKKPYFGSDESSNSSTESDSNHKGKTTKNPNAEVFTTKRTNSTQSTTVVPDIDIRLRVPEES